MISSNTVQPIPIRRGGDGSSRILAPLTPLSVTTRTRHAPRLQHRRQAIQAPAPAHSTATDVVRSSHYHLLCRCCPKANCQARPLSCSHGSPFPCRRFEWHHGQQMADTGSPRVTLTPARPSHARSCHQFEPHSSAIALIMAHCHNVALAPSLSRTPNREERGRSHLSQDPGQH